MPEDRNQNISARKKRVKRLKRLIILTLLALMILPLVCCIVLLFQVHRLNARMDELAGQLAEMQSSIQQQDDAEKVPEISVSMKQGEAPDAGVLPVQPSPDSMAEDVPAAEDKAAEDAKHKVYLTFDDGPSIYTDDILDVLEEYGVKATFFVVGKEDERSKAAIGRIVEEGHTLGMHSYSHKYSELYASKENFAADLEKLQTYLYDLTGVESRFYRFPGGSSNTVSSVSIQELADYLDSQGIVFYDWNVASGDGGSTLLSVETLIDNSTKDLEHWETAIILMHDSADKPTTVEALPSVIEQIMAMEDTAILPISEDTVPVQHIHRNK